MIPTLLRAFTPKERQIAELVGDGLTYQQIGAALAPPIAACTVRSYVIRMAIKIDVGGRTLEPQRAVFMMVMQERARGDLLVNSSPPPAMG